MDFLFYVIFFYSDVSIAIPAFIACATEASFPRRTAQAAWTPLRATATLKSIPEVNAGKKLF